jgi:ACR3 family arsenite efflux pump ArsB
MNIGDSIVNTVVKLAAHFKKNLLYYALASIVLGWGLGLFVPNFVQAHEKIFNALITVFVFLMIYPMMIDLDLKKIPGVLKRGKPVVLTLIYSFILTPLLSLVFVTLFIHDSNIAIGFMLVMLVPGSSMSLGYTGLVEGSLELGTVAISLIFVLIPFLLPFFLGFLGHAYKVDVPVELLVQTVILVLILPMLVGILTRWGIFRTKGKDGYQKVKPFFSLVTMLTLLFMVTLIFMVKATVLLSKWDVVVTLAVITLAYLVIMFPLMTLLDKIFKVNYADHMAVAFLSTGKNNGTAIAIAMLAFNPLVAIPAAILPLFQVIFSIGYVSMAEKVKKYFGFVSKNEKALK